MRKYYIIITAVIILSFLFYWYSYRPSKIRSACLAEAEFNRFNIYANDKERQQFLDDYYKNCLRRFGLER